MLLGNQAILFADCYYVRDFTCMFEAQKKM